MPGGRGSEVRSGFQQCFVPTTLHHPLLSLRATARGQTVHTARSMPSRRLVGGALALGLMAGQAAAYRGGLGLSWEMDKTDITQSG